MPTNQGQTDMIEQVQSEQINQANAAGDRKLWVKPELTLIKAGSAEAGGSVQNDGGIGRS